MNVSDIVVSLIMPKLKIATDDGDAEVQSLTGWGEMTEINKALSQSVSEKSAKQIMGLLMKKKKEIGFDEEIILVKHLKLPKNSPSDKNKKKMSPSIKLLTAELEDIDFSNHNLKSDDMALKYLTKCESLIFSEETYAKDMEKSFVSGGIVPDFETEEEEIRKNYMTFEMLKEK